MISDLKHLAVQRDKYTYDVKPERLVRACHIAINNGYEHLTLITAIDWKDKWELVYHIVKYGETDILTFIVMLPYDNPTISSLTNIWPSADWHERETYDLMGIHFEGHPDLRRILLPKEYEAHPLRKEVKHGNRS